MAIKNRVILVFTLFVIVSSAQAKIYRWTDAQGRPHFSDAQHKDATEVQLPPLHVYQPKKTEESSLPDSAVMPSATGQPIEAIVQQTIHIQKPGNETTIRNVHGNVEVNVSLKPAHLREGQNILILMDGHAMGKAQKSQQRQFVNVDRGAHQLVAKLIDAKEQVLAESESITFFMHRTFKKPS